MLQRLGTPRRLVTVLETEARLKRRIGFVRPRAAVATDRGFGHRRPARTENWGARLSLIEELLLARAAEVAHYTQPLRTIARLSALSTRISRAAGDRVVRYAF